MVDKSYDAARWSPGSEASEQKPASVRSAVDRVEEIQQILAECGLYAGAIDGICAAQTLKAMYDLAHQAVVERKGWERDSA